MIISYVTDSDKVVLYHIVDCRGFEIFIWWMAVHSLVLANFVSVLDLFIGIYLKVFTDVLDKHEFRL